MAPLNKRTPTPPSSETELMQRATQLAGMSFADLAASAQVCLPETLKLTKGWLGQLLEWHLGADANNLSEPDFRKLDIELKTLPLDKQQRPRESTYVCTAPFDSRAQLEHWHSSRVYNKLKRVLWFPIEAHNIPLTERRLGYPFLWTMPAAIERILAQDWEDLMEMLHLGEQERLSAHFGRYLQVRPKAAHSHIRTRAFDMLGQPVSVNPRGFYLRSQCTRQIMRDYFEHSTKS